MKPWPERMLADAVASARAKWGDAWRLLTADMRRAYVAHYAIAAIAALDVLDPDEDDGSGLARAQRTTDRARVAMSVGRLAALVMTFDEEEL